MRHFAIVATFICITSGAVFAQDPHQKTESLIGTLKGASYFDSHEGKPSWAAFVVSKRGTYLLTGGGDDYPKFKKLSGKRVVAEGMISVEMRDPEGKIVKLGGKLAGIEYVGVVAVSKIDDVSEQKPVELEGVVEEYEMPDPKDAAKKIKMLRLNTSKPDAGTYSCSDAAKKKLSGRVGKEVKVRCYVDGSTIDEIESVGS